MLRFLSACLLGAFCLMSLSTACLADPADIPTPQQLYAEGNFAQARDAYQALLKQSPDSLELAMGLMRADLCLNDRVGAYEAGTQALPYGKSDADFLGLYAIVQMRYGEPESAPDTVAQALKLDPDSYWALVAAGELAVWDNKTDQGMHDFRLATVKDPDGVDAWLGMAKQINGQTGVGAANLEALKKFVALNPKGAPYDHDLSESSIMLKYYPSYWSYYDSHPAFQMVAPVKEAVLDSKTPPKLVATEVPFTIKSGWAYVPVTIDGKLFHFVLDSGANGILLSKPAAARLHLPVLAKSTDMGVQGEETLDCLRADTLSFGTFQYRNVPLEASDSPSNFGDGIIGTGAFTNYVITFDYHEKKIMLQTGSQAKAPAPLPGDQTMTTPFHFIEGLILMPAMVAREDNKKPYTVWSVLDTGSFSDLVSIDLAEDLAVGLPSGDVLRQTVKQKMGIGTSQLGMSFVAVRTKAVMEILQKNGGWVSASENPVIGASPLGDLLSPVLGVELSLLFGNPFTDHCQKMTIDYPDDTVTFEVHPLPPPPSNTKQSSTR